MKLKHIWSDIDGDLVFIEDSGSSQYGKRLSLDVAWHIDMFDDLENIPGGIIQRVDQDFTENQLLIHYNSAVIPLPLEQVRELLALHRSFGLFRLAKLAMDLCKSLMELHGVDIYQMVIHPLRLAQFEKQFVVLPTLAGVLPPLSSLADHENVTWLHYLAPEVMRTRGDDSSLLPAADVYSLGRTLQVLSSLDWEPEPIGDALSYLESSVEFSAVRQPENMISDNNSFSDLIREMCSFFPEDRPSLADVLDRLENGIIDTVEPKKLIQDSILAGRLDQFKDSFTVLQEMQQSELFNFPAVDLYRISANYELGKSPPDYLKAIGQLIKIADVQPDNVDILLEIAGWYASISNQSQHLQLAVDYYESALLVSRWRQDILDAWLEILVQLNDPKLILQAIEDIPLEKQTSLAMKISAKCSIDQGEYLQAWHEAVRFFRTKGFDREVYDYARQAAYQIEPLLLMLLKKEYEGVEGLEPAVSIIWERNGNLSKARECFWLQD